MITRMIKTAYQFLKNYIVKGLYSNYVKNAKKDIYLKMILVGYHITI